MKSASDSDGVAEAAPADARRCAECSETLAGKFYGAGRGDGTRFMCPECFWRDRAHAYEMDMLDAREEANRLREAVAAEREACALDACGRCRTIAAGGWKGVRISAAQLHEGRWQHHAQHSYDGGAAWWLPCEASAIRHRAAAPESDEEAS